MHGYTFSQNRISDSGNLRSLKPHRKRTFVAVAVVLCAALATLSSFALANSGSISTAIKPPLGSPTSGAVASVDTSIATNVTASNGSAQLDAGVVLARVSVTPIDAANLKVDVFWTNPYDSTKLLNSPNTQISIGLYHPVHSGSCVNSDSTETDILVSVTDTNGTYCAALDSAARGSSNVGSGKILESPSMPSGYLKPTVSDNGSLATCTTPSSDSSRTSSASVEAALPWCQPAGVSGVLYVVASILTPGGVPPGKQSSLGHLSFYINATPL
jgi:hypothetical protein